MHVHACMCMHACACMHVHAHAACTYTYQKTHTYKQPHLEYTQEREDQMKKKAESLAKEVVRLRAEIKRGGGGGVEAADEGDSKDNLPKDREQMLLSQISKLREENKELRDMAQSNEARSIGLHDTSVRPRLSNSPNISSNMPSSPQVTPMPDLKSPMSQPSESPRVVREDKVRSHACTQRGEQSGRRGQRGEKAGRKVEGEGAKEGDRAAC